MTTETTSLTLHERLTLWCDHTERDDEHITYHDIEFSGIADIESAIRAEATAPLRQEIERLVKERDDQRAEAEGFREHLVKRNETVRALRAENAALRQAADALRSSLQWFVKGYTPLASEAKETDAAIAAYDAATTPRAEETPMQVVDDGSGGPNPDLSPDMIAIIDEVDAADASTVESALTFLAGKKGASVAQVIRDAIYTPSPTDALPQETWGQAKSRLADWMSDYLLSSGMTDIKHPGHRAKLAWYLGCKETGTPIKDEYLVDPDPSPTDAAGEGTASLVQDAIDVGNPTKLAILLGDIGARIAALEARAADQDPALQARPHKERIDDLVTRADGASSRLDLHMHRMDELWRRIAALEARGTTPQPVAEVSAPIVITEKMCRAYVTAYNDNVRNGPSGNDPVAFGLAAALAAKDGGK